MRAIITRRTLIAPLSAVALIAVVAVTAFSLSQRQPQARAASSRHNPSMSYQVSVTASATPDASSASPSGATRHGASTGAGAGQATPTPPANHPGGAIAWSVPGDIPGDYASVIGSYAVYSQNGAMGWLTAQVDMRNSGTTTWLGDWSYYAGCVSNCLGGYSVPANSIASGQSQMFAIQLYVPTIPWITETYYSEWAMFHSPSPGGPAVQFGETATVKIVVTDAKQLGVDPAPGCDTSSMTWTVTGGACANGGLALTTSTAQEPTAALQSAPAGFDDTNYFITVDASFSGATGAWVRLVGYNWGSQCVGQGVDVRPDGSYRAFYIAGPDCAETDFTWSTSPYGSSPIEVTLELHNGEYAFDINHHPIEHGGSLFTGGYPVISAGGPDGSVVTVTNAELDTLITATTQWSVLQNGHQRM
jgi:hypothetical protein